MLFQLTNICTVSVPLLAIVILYTVNITESKQAKQLPNALQNVLRKYGKQYNDFDIEDSLRAKVAKLIPFLDDNKHNIKEKERLALRDLQENNNMKNRNLNPVNKKYKSLRKEIQKLLKIEAVSEDTKRAVTNALDQITADLMRNECLWKKKAEEDEKPMTMDQPELVINHIKQKWNKIFDQYSIKYIGSNETARKAFALLTGLRKFVFDVHEEYKRLESRYATRCEIVDKNKQEAVNSLEENELSECETICSVELLNFMMRFYQQLKMTYFDLFNNYIQMYKKEVTRDDAEESLENHVNKIKDHVEKKIKNSFEEGADAVEFTKNHTLSMYDAVSNFIDKVIENTKKIIDKSLHTKLRNVSPKLRMTIREDLHTTASIELGNLRQDLKNSMCTAFRTCNGVLSRKYIKGNDNSLDSNSINLNLKLRFDKSTLKEALEVFNSRKMNALFSGLEKSVHKTLQTSTVEPTSNNDNLTEPQIGYKVSQTTNFDNDHSNVTKTIGGSSTKIHVSNEIPFDINKYEHVNVTRTTLKPYFERGTTKVTSIKLVNTNATV